MSQNQFLISFMFTIPLFTSFPVCDTVSLEYLVCLSTAKFSFYCSSPLLFLSNLKRWCCESAALQYNSKFGKLSIGHGTGKGQFSFQSQKRQCKECSNYHTIAIISHASKVMLTIPKARLQQYVNHKLRDVQVGFRKFRRTRDQIANTCWIIKKAIELQKNIHFCFIDYAKVFDCVDHHKLWKILKEIGLPDHLTFLLRNLYAGQEATVRTGQGTTDWFQIGKGVRQGCLLSPCLFIYMQSTSWEMLGWKKHNLESRLLGEISITTDMQMKPPLWQKAKN